MENNNNVNNNDSNPTSQNQNVGIWATPGQPHFAFVSTTQMGQQQQQAPGVANVQQAAALAAFPQAHVQYADSQFHTLGAFQLPQAQAELYQQAQSSFERESPSVDSAEFQNPIGSSNNETLQFQGLAADGTHMLRGLPRSAVVTGFPIQVLIGQSSDVAASLSSASVVSSVSSHTLAPAVSLGSSIAPSNSDSTQNQPLIQVVAAMQQFSQAESTTSEASPLGVHVESPMAMRPDSHRENETNQVVSSINYAFQSHIDSTNNRKTRGLETFTSEADTTQEDSPRHTVTHYHHHSQDDEYPEAESSHLPMDSNDMDQAIESGVSQSGLDSTINDDVNIDTTIASPMAGTTDLLADARIHTTIMSPLPGPSGISSGINQNRIGQMSLPLALPHTNGLSVSPTENEDLDLQRVRKSDRLACLDRPRTPVERPVYRPQTYNPYKMWCEECMTAYANECPIHKIQPMQDKVVLSRAWSSLPGSLQIFRLGDTTDLGVFAKKPIPKRTQFGPYVGELVDVLQKLSSDKFVLLLDKDNGEVAYFESNDENKCNWMMFIRPAENFTEQNLVAYQYGTDIYFSSIKNIEPRQELKVWYAAHYADRVGKTLHTLGEEELAALDAEEKRWPCYECNERFKTSAQLQQHLSIHDDTSGRAGSSSGNVRSSIQKGKRKGFILRASGILKKKKVPTATLR